MKTGILIGFLFGISCLMAAPSAHAKPGAEHVLEEKTTTATLYLTEIHRDPQNKVFVRVVWIPDDAVKRCLGKSVDFCRKLDNCTTFPDAQKCGPELSNCKKIIRPECKEFGFTLQSIEKRRRKTIPHRVLDTMPYDHAEQFLPFLRSWELLADFQGVRKLEEIDQRYSVRAEVHWQLWTNGQGFKILRLLD